MFAEQRDPAVCASSDNKESKGEMTKAPISLRDLRRRIYRKAKTEPAWRFWGLYVHVCKLETLRESYRQAKLNNGAPGIDGVTFAAIEAEGLETWLQQLRAELLEHSYGPTRLRRVAIPKPGGTGVRVLSIPTIRDRVVQGELILEPIFEADFQSGSYGYRPKRSAHAAVERVAQAIVHHKTRVADIDLRSFFDNVRHHILFEKVARRVNDLEVMHLLKLLVKATGKKGLSQGGVLSPVLSNVYLNEVDRMLERARETTRRGPYTYLEYARFADDLVVLVDGYAPHGWLLKAVNQRLREELAKLQVDINEEKSRHVDLAKGESFGFLGFEFRWMRSLQGKWRPYYPPKLKQRTTLLRKLKDIFRRFDSQPVGRVVQLINPIVRGWVNYFAIGDSSLCFGAVKDWVEKKVRRHLMRARNRQGFGWRRWSRRWLYGELGLFNNYRVRRPSLTPKALPAR
jgi:RNA-directed DNA polymerase